MLFVGFVFLCFGFGRCYLPGWGIFPVFLVLLFFLSHKWVFNFFFQVLLCFCWDEYLHLCFILFIWYDVLTDFSFKSTLHFWNNPTQSLWIVGKTCINQASISGSRLPFLSPGSGWHDFLSLNNTIVPWDLEINIS